jgi:hypothetical protein
MIKKQPQKTLIKNQQKTAAQRQLKKVLPKNKRSLIVLIF